MRLESHADANQQIARMAEKDVIAKYSEAIWAWIAASETPRNDTSVFCVTVYRFSVLYSSVISVSFVCIGAIN